MTERTGGCLCGEVRYRLTAEPIVARICWCHDCQHIAGNGTANAIFPAANIEITGSVSEYVSMADSGNYITRRFCSLCGCHLFADSSGRPGFSVVRLGTLDDPSSIKPQANIWSGSAPSWACLDASIPRFEQQPPPPKPAPA
jgi:hypothetical protein